ncbi:accessory Sec system glycosyltransferase Asp1 [Paucilactobacillus nenjiangensis]|uniref:accessory Sec system glycosyltransferase Asp1 n=1 Tax=Paucilactobacillus nenjiangensis TaxID=1296540 RepID=UPI003BAF6534
MFFFVNEYILGQNSSVEHAEFKRIKLFDQHNEPARIVTRNHDNQLHRTIKKFHLIDGQIINMFDFFGDTVDYQGRELKARDLDIPIDYQVSTGNNSRTIKDGGRLIGEMHFASGTVGQIARIDYVDGAGNLTNREQYDIRGFKSVDEFFDNEGHLFYQIYYRPDGTRYMERHYIKSTANTPINSLNRLIDYRGKDRFFNTIDDLFAFFLNELNMANDENNVFIADRPAMANQPVMQITSKAKKYLWIPMDHVRDGQDEVIGAYDGSYAVPFTPEGLKKLTGVIVMTNAQRENLQTRLPKFKNKIYTISGTIAEEHQPVKLNARQHGSLLYVGRLGNDKQIDQLLQAYKLIHEAVPETNIDVYGYGSKPDMEKFEQQVIDLKIDDDSVNFKGYQPNVENVYDSAQLMLDLGKRDGQPLAMMEGLSHGVPVVSYAYNYGPAEMIDDGQNGRLIEANNISAIAQAAIEILQDDTQWQKMSDAAYANSTAFSPEKVWKQWEQIRA